MSLTKRVKSKDDLGDRQGRPEDYQQCQDLTRTSDAKSERQYDVSCANLFKTFHFYWKNYFGECCEYKNEMQTSWNDLIRFQSAAESGLT